MTPVDYEHRSCLRLRVTLHFGRQFADLRRVREPTMLVRHHADRQRHQRHARQLAAPVLTEIIARAAVLLVVLIRHERIEHIEYLAAHRPDAFDRQHKDEIVAADVPHEALFPDHAPHDIVQDAGEQVDHAIAVVVTDRKSTRLNSSHVRISYAVFCLKKKKGPTIPTICPAGTSNVTLCSISCPSMRYRTVTWLYVFFF